MFQRADYKQEDGTYIQLDYIKRRLQKKRSKSVWVRVGTDEIVNVTDENKLNIKTVKKCTGFKRTATLNQENGSCLDLEYITMEQQRIRANSVWVLKNTTKVVEVFDQSKLCKKARVATYKTDEICLELEYITREELRARATIDDSTLKIISKLPVPNKLNDSLVQKVSQDLGLEIKKLGKKIQKKIGIISVKKIKKQYDYNITFNLENYREFWNKYFTQEIIAAVPSNPIIDIPTCTAQELNHSVHQQESSSFNHVSNFYNHFFHHPQNPNENGNQETSNIEMNLDC